MFDVFRFHLSGALVIMLLAVACSSGNDGPDASGSGGGARTEAVVGDSVEFTITRAADRSPEEPLPTPTQQGVSHDDAAPVPTGLTLPFDASASRQERDFISPFGVVRKSNDLPEFGHGGIDVPMANGAPIFAVGDGVIRDVEPSVDSRPGSVVELLLTDDPDAKLGWIFLYEHIDLEPGLEVGAVVKRGQQIGSNAMATGESNNHLQLTYVFTEEGFTRDHTCWVDQLDDEASSAIDAWFGQYTASEAFLSGWNTAIGEGYYTLRGLLDTDVYPDGPQLCYEPGTDARVVY